jgi:hypothetical protein
MNKVLLTALAGFLLIGLFTTAASAAAPSEDGYLVYPWGIEVISLNPFSVTYFTNLPDIQPAVQTTPQAESSIFQPAAPPRPALRSPYRPPLF